MKKNNKGFSLVELIIVIAIMVALIAVLAPSYVKYVAKSRTSAYQNAVEDFLSSVKESYADPDRVQSLSDGSILVKIPNGKSSLSDLIVASDDNMTAVTLNYLKTAANLGDKKLQKVETTATSSFKITITSSGEKITMTPIDPIKAAE